MNTFHLQVGLFLAGVPLLADGVAQAQNPVPVQANQTQNTTTQSATTQSATTQSATLLNSLFSDDAILQRDHVIPIWGQATPGETVTAKLDNQTLSTRADASGRWMVRVGPLAASATPHTLSVSSGTENVMRRNIVIGDVWLCSGQSNMEFGVGNLTNAKEEIAAANYTFIRLFTVPKKVAFTPQTELSSRWLVCNPQNISQGAWNGFSAVAYFFGRKLHQELGVPIGLIHSSWGGTEAEAWVSQSALGTLPDFRPELARVQQAVRDEKVPFEQRTEAWFRQISPHYQSNWATSEADVSKWETIHVPGEWDASGVAALSDFDGIALFRSEIEVPSEWVEHDLRLNLGNIDDNDVTYWNGVQVGSTNGFGNKRQYTIPAAQVRAGRNIIGVRVTDTGGGGGLTSSPETLRLERDAATFLPLAGDWKFLVSASLAQMATAPIHADQNNPNVTSALYNGMIAPIVPFGIKGAIWYQGEQNSSRAAQYEQLLSTLIADWRQQFQTPMPFYIVQLAGFMAPDDTPKNDDWPQLRAAQMKVAQTVPKTGIAITTDIGDEKDIHPKDKQDVGLRLALVALAKTYRRQVESSGPTLQSVKSDGAKLRLSFSHAESGLTLKGDATRVFAVAGADRNWFWATPQIEGNRVILTSPVVPRPLYARYAWSNLPRATLYNGANLPSPPFQTLHHESTLP